MLYTKFEFYYVHDFTKNIKALLTGFDCEIATE